MAHIYVYSPSGAVRDRAALRRGIKRLQAQGHEVELDPDALSAWQRFAGDDGTRLAALQRAAASGADVALITRGGYGISRLLPRLPGKALARAIGKGTQFVGLSDFTALQLALWQQTGAITWGGPTLCADLGAPGGVDDIMQACLDDLLDGTGEGTGWRLPADDVAAYGQRLSGTLARDALLWGGNLSMVQSLLGTPWWPGIRGGVLFLEDVGEHPYRIERMLLQLLHAGVLAQQKAVVLGQFTEYRASAHDRGFNLAQVVQHLRAQLKKTLLLTGLPFGHVPTKVLLPVGARVDLLAQGRDALLLWGHLHAHGHEHEHGHAQGAACGCGGHAHS